MHNATRMLETIKGQGGKLTAVRKEIIHIFAEANAPLSAQELQRRLSRRKKLPNKTTVYREIAFLVERRIVREITFNDRKKRYEAELDAAHHHHLVCVRCDGVEDVALAGDLDRQERSISRSRGFMILNHSLEFFGVCRTCK